MTPEGEAEAERESDAHARSDERWYAAGLRFECTGCGHCCRGGDGHVWVDLEEIRKLADSLALPINDFGRRYLRRVGRRYALLERSLGGDCVFLRENRCSVYEARPGQCRTFPFWPALLESPEAWTATARACEGIRDDAPLVARAEIERLCPSLVADATEETASGAD